MKIGIDSFVAAVPDALTGENLGPAESAEVISRSQLTYCA
jgi:hypothetical protein